MLHPALTSSPPNIRLWGISDTVNAFLAASGDLLNNNNRVSVVIIVVLLGVPRVWFFFLYSGSFTRCVASNEIERRCHV